MLLSAISASVRPVAPLVAFLFGAAALSGCLFQPPPQETACTINRIITATFDTGQQDTSGEPKSEGESLYEHVKPSFKITLNNGGEASRFQVSYTDQLGNRVSRALSDFTSGSIPPGGTVTVPDINLTSPGSVTEGGNALCTRGFAFRDWFRIQQQGIGFLMDPGSALVYSTTAGGSFGGSISDIEWTPPGSDSTVKVNRADLEFNTDASGALSLTFANAPETVDTPDQSRQARKLDWSVSSTTHFPGSFEFDSIVDGEPFQFGIDVTDTKASVTAAGHLFVDTDSEIIRFALERGEIEFDAKVTAWSNKEDFEVCGGKTKEDQCEPEFIQGKLPIQQAIPHSSSDPRPREPSDEKGFIQTALEGFLAESLQVGDRLTAEFILRERVYAFALPEGFLAKVTFTLEATSLEDLTVPAGSFPAVKMLQELVVDVESPGAGDEGISIHETLSRVTSWLHRENFLVLKVRGESPVDFNKFVQDLVKAIPDAYWAQLGTPRPDPESFSVVADGVTTVELTRLSGSAAMSPWIGVMLAQVLPLVAGSSFGLIGTLGAGGFGSLLGGGAQQTKPVTAAISIATYDIDTDAKTDSIRITLSQSPQALPWTQVQIVRNGTVMGASGAAPLTQVYENSASMSSEPIVLGSESTSPGDWANGDSLFMRCDTVGSGSPAVNQEIIVVIRGTVVHTQAVLCEESVA